MSRLPTCREMTALFAAYLDEALPPDQAGAFQEHLDRCPVCVAYLESLKGVGRLARATLARDEVPAEVQAMASALLERFRKG